MKLRKSIALLLVVVLTLGLIITGCGSQQQSTTGSDQSTQKDASAVTTSTDKKVKIGLSFLDSSVPFAKDVITMCKAAAKALDCELVVLADGFDPDKQIANIENLAASGCDAVMICNSSEAVVPKMIKICEDKKVGFGLFFRTINDQKIKDLANNSKYFVGVTHEDETNAGYELGKALFENGSKNAVIINFNHGDTVAEARYAGYMKAFKEDGVKVLGEQWEIITGEKATAATESFLTAFPELDTVVVVGGGGENLNGALSAIKNHNLTGKIRVSSTDFIPELKQKIENKEITTMSGGHWVDPFYEFILLYNWASGHPLTQDKAEIVVNQLFISSPEMAGDYEKWCTGEVLPYTDEEIRNLTVKFNPKMDYQTLLDTAKNYSLEDVMKRHEGLIQ